MSAVLFLCSGNYYRSRFAEIYFNWIARQRNCAWMATSRGLDLYAGNPGPVSVYTRARVEQLGIAPESPWRAPQALVVEDLESADHVVAVKATEHRPLLAKLFPAWLERVEFWEVHDLDCCTPDETLAHLEREVTALLDRLADAAKERH